MSLPLLPPTNETHFTMSGDVTLHPGAAIAPGVVLQADPGSRIIIEAGVCIGMGALLHAYQGQLEIAQGAALGFKVLVVGAGRIGANACIGPGVTIIASSVEDGSVIPAGTIIGDTGRSPAPPETSPSSEATTAAPPTPPSHSSHSPTPGHHSTELPEPTPIVSNAFSYTAYSETNVYAASYAVAKDESTATSDQPSHISSADGDSAAEPTPPTKENSPSNSAAGSVSGQASLNRLVGMLFPHRQALENKSDENQDSSSDTADPFL
jgi:carbon dioxide concentrating mechanism protein CcmN